MTDPAPQLTLDVDLDPRVHYALHQNDVPVVKEVRLTNDGAEDLHDLDVAVTIGANLAKPWTKRLDHLRAGATHRLTALDLGLDPEILRNQTEREATSLQVVVTQGAGEGLRRLAELEKPVEILAFREWAGLRSLPELLAAFVLPNQKSVQGLLARTATRLQQATGRSSLAGYQERNPQRIRATVAAVFQALHDCQLRYANPPASFEEEGQKVRLPDDVLETRLGTCLDLTLLAAAALEQIGLHPLLVLTRGHAFVGCWLEERTFAECVVVDGVRLRKRIDVGDVLVFEATRLTEDHACDFEGALARSRQQLDDLAVFQCAVDVRQARVQRIRPLPVREAASYEITAETLAAEDVPPAPNPTPVVDPDPAPTMPPPGTSAPQPDPAPAATPPEPELPTDPKERRIEGWKRRLLDLTYRNRLLAFRDSRRAIPLLLRDAAHLEDRLAGGSWFVCRPAPQIERDTETHQQTSGEDLAQAIARDELDRRRLLTPLTALELDKRLIEVWRHARASLEETGANTLFLAVGMLRYREAAHSSVERHAPILLLPVEIERQSVREGFRLRIADDDAQVNVTLLEKLRAEFGIDPTGLDELPEDDEGLDVPAILQNFRRKIVDLDGFEVEPVCQVAIFSFQKFLMWRDLQARSGDLLKNPVVAHLVERSGRGYEADAEYPDPAVLDDTRKVIDTLCPMNADSSQLAAVFASSEGRSFVLEGPPGTGKSQTITNLIAQNLAAGRRVLFVSEKRAALEVVRDRLGRIGLGAFCLELHSNKASKKEVLEQLLEAFELSGAREPQDWAQVAGDLESERTALNGYVRTIHEPRGFGESLFQVTSRLIGLRDAPRVALELGDVTTLDAGAVAKRREAVDRLTTAVREVGTVAGHPFAAVRRTEWRVTLPDEVDATLGEVDSALRRWKAALDVAAGRLGVPSEALDKARVHAVEELAALVVAAPGAAPALYTEAGWATVREQALAAVEAGRARDELRRHVGKHFAIDALLRLPLDELRTQAQAAHDTFWPLSWWKGRAPAAALKPAVARGKALGDWSEVVEHLDQAIELRRQTEALAEPGHDGARLFGGLWRRGEPTGDAPWDALASAVEQAGRLRAALLRLREGLDESVGRSAAERVVRLVTEERDLVQQGHPAGDELRGLAEARAGADAARKRLDDLLMLDASAWEAPDAWVPGLLDRVAVWQREQRARLRDWLYFRETRDAAAALGLEPLVAGLEHGDFGRDALLPGFERSFRESWWTAVVDADPGLRSFVGADHERRIKRFRELDKQALELAEKLVTARLAAKVPSFETAASEASELGVLQREARKKRRHLPVRKLFERIPNLIPRIKPCVLMSPLSVAQYLDPAAPPYDLVVFDEASQITVWDSVGALARGAAAVVVGDSRQLPPTSFFQKMEEDDAPDDLDMEELESVLDECTAAGFRSMRLGWHYRSRHESLIAFSNYHYYDNRLHTFPSPVEDPAQLGVSWVQVTDGVYDRSKSRTNPKEAESVVRDLVTRLRTEVDDRSYGIVTFSRAQQELIEDLLDQARRDDATLERWFTGVEEPVFVKNLENVQGDERDVILFSICYGPDEAGKLAMNFGPLNIAGGERRLNVAVTRARRQVIVHSTLTADRIDLSRTNATGVHHLKTFLDYAARGPVALAEAVELHGGATYDSPFERAVAERLRAKGHDVELQVGCSGYRIDLAIRDPERPGRFLLGIECDGAFYHSAKTARDRDRIRQAVLEGLGWQLCRIWSTDWWRSPERELERVEEALERARREAAARAERQARQAEARAAELARQADEVLDRDRGMEGEVRGPEVASVAEDDADERSSMPERYASAGVPVAEPPVAGDAVAPDAEGPIEVRYQAVVVVPKGSSSDVYEPKAVATIHALAREVLELEAPIHRALFQRRLAGAYEARLTSKVRARLDALVASLPAAEQPVLHGEFLWRRDQDPAAWSTWRAPGDGPDAQRDAEEIPPQEVAACAAEVLAAQIALPREDLARETARRLGFARMGKRVEEAMAAGLALLIDRGRARVEGDNLVAPG